MRICGLYNIKKFISIVFIRLAGSHKEDMAVSRTMLNAETLSVSPDN